MKAGVWEAKKIVCERSIPVNPSADFVCVISNYFSHRLKGICYEATYPPEKSHLKAESRKARSLHYSKHFEE